MLYSFLPLRHIANSRAIDKIKQKLGKENPANASGSIIPRELTVDTNIDNNLTQSLHVGDSDLMASMGPKLKGK